MEKDKIVFKGSHPDSLYRVAADSSAGASKVTRVLRVLRWPVALVAVCVALAVFVYFLMPDNLEARSEADAENGTYWEPVVAGHRPHYTGHLNKKSDNNNHGTKTSEIDFYGAENDNRSELTVIVDTTTETIPKRTLPIPPVFPTHLSPEVQYGNEKADTDKLRTPKLLEDDDSAVDSTIKPHITQKPEKPLAIYFKNGSDATSLTTEVFTRAETINDFTNYDQKQTTKRVQENSAKTHPTAYKENAQIEYKPQSVTDHHSRSLYNQQRDQHMPLDVEEFFGRRLTGDDVNFTSGHSKLFGISIEDAEKMKSTTQSSLYNTRVSPTLPTWRDGDDTTTKKYPSNIYSEVQCRSTRMSLCRGVLPYDLAGTPAKVGKVEISSLLPQIDYMVASNCSERVRHFVCALLEPECNPPPFPTKLPCYNLCKAIVDSCDGHIPSELSPVFNCKQYSRTNCVGAKTPCYPREFPCSDGSCVPRDWICDGSNDCPGGEDEATCIQCDQTEYRCSSGGCILKRWLCDGYTDCPDGEDEYEETCGTRSQQTGLRPGHLATDPREPGEEPAGSAPAPAVRRPNRVPVGRKGDSQRAGEIESSKELLITSDSNNALKRNYTRRPLPPRLSHYHRHQSLPKEQEVPKEVTTDRSLKKVMIKKPEAEKTTQKNINENESIEDVNMGDLGFFDEFDKEGKDQAQNPADPKSQQRAKAYKFGVPTPSSDTLVPAVQTTRLDKTANKFDRVIDGAALLKKAAAAQAAETAEDVSMNDTYVDKDDVPVNTAPRGPPPTSNRRQPNTPAVNIAKTSDTFPTNAAGTGGNRGDFGKGDWTRAHASPCPSGELRCVDGRCITLAQLCDGTIDCSDHADEDNCYT